MKPFKRLLRAAVVVLLIFSGPAAAEESVQEKSAKGYEFTEDWFSVNIPLWTEQLAAYRGRPVHYLEVGLFEGRSAIWMLENILTHPDARLTGIDIFPGDLKARYLKNLERSGAGQKAVTLEGRSQAILRHLPAETFDIIYIDGSHRGDDTLEDLVLSWDLLKPGGLLIIDDYLWGDYLPPELRPKWAVDSLLSAFRNEFDVLHREKQVILRKTEHPCPGNYCTRIGPYIYVWSTHLDPESPYLMHRERKERISLSPQEQKWLERLFRRRAFGKTGFASAREEIRHPDFERFLDRLGLSELS